jgi:hypothetical protein
MINLLINIIPLIVILIIAIKQFIKNENSKQY